MDTKCLGCAAPEGGVVCAACRAGKLPDQGWTVFRIPKSHHHARLHDFGWEHVRPASTQKVVTGFFYDVMVGQTTPHLILTGAPGIGKTHIGIGLYRLAAATLGTQLCTWVNVPAFCEAVKRGYSGEGAGELWSDYEGAKRLVVLDDLFGRDLTAHEASQIVYRMLDTAYTNNACVCITANPPVEEFANRLPPHEISRVLAHSTIIPMTSTKDFRR